MADHDTDGEGTPAGQSGAADGPPVGEASDSDWAGLIGEEGASGVDRILNQDEIDALLGFSFGHDDDGEMRGIRALIDSAMVSYERLPMLEIVFDRLVRLLTTSLRNFTSDSVEVGLENISSVRFGDYLNSIALPAILAVFKAREWDNYGLFAVESNLIYSVVDVLLGGRRRTHSMRIEGRPYTTIELALVERMIEVVLADAEAAFEPLSKVSLELERLETNPRFAAISRSANAAILVQFRVDMEDRGGKIEMLLPYATIEPIRDLLLQMFMGERFGHDSIWEGHLATELWSTNVRVDAVLDEVKVPLSKVLQFEVGQTLMLTRGPDSPVSLRCGNIDLTEGRLGRVEETVAVRVSHGIRKAARLAASGTGEASADAAEAPYGPVP